MTASFEDAVLVHAAATAVPGVEIVLLDTQYLFAETRWLIDELQARLPLNLRVVHPLPEVRPDNRWQTDTESCCQVRKDARHGVVDQTRRHGVIAALLGVQQIVVAVNKMDLVDWDEGAFLRIAKEVHEFVDALPHPAPVHAIPMSALLGDNVVERSTNMPWYDGPPLLEYLEDLDATDPHQPGARIHVQRVIRPQGGEHADFRGCAGVVHGGSLAVGDSVTILPSGRGSTVAAISRWGVPVAHAATGHAVVVELADDVDVARGDVIAGPSPTLPSVGHDVVVDLCWMIDAPLTKGSRWWFKHGTRTGHAIVIAVQHRFDLTAVTEEAADRLELNGIGRVHLPVTEPIVADGYHVHAPDGRLILIDPATNTTAAAAMVVEVRP